MSLSEKLKEAKRVMVICNACRYCEGYCAVFPAMELRRVISDQDTQYFSNLCHNCRSCYYACQFAPPHEYDLNVPKALAELRLETYSKFAWPGFLGSLFKRNGLAVSIITLLSILIVFLLTYFSRGSEVLTSVHSGENAFYQVIPFMSMVVPMSVLAIFVLISLMAGVGRLWRGTGGSWGDFFKPQANFRALWDALRLRYLDGYDLGCNYPDERFSLIRKRFHHAVFYGFFLCLAATVVASYYDHYLHWPAPYPLLSLPVILGSIGGVLLLIGTAGMLYLKQRMDRAPAAPVTFNMDMGFMILLFLTTLSGLLLMIFRETAAMGGLLVVHIGFVAAFFITMPYGKFIHAVYRYTALVRNAIEQMREESKSS